MTAHDKSLLRVTIERDNALKRVSELEAQIEIQEVTILHDNCYYWTPLAWKEFKETKLRNEELEKDRYLPKIHPEDKDVLLTDYTTNLLKRKLKIENCADEMYSTLGIIMECSDIDDPWLCSLIDESYCKYRDLKKEEK